MTSLRPSGPICTMVIGFEHLTAHLTDEELSIAPVLAKKLAESVGPKKAMKNADCRIYLSMHKFYTTGPRLRKIINHIRINQLCHNLIATSQGYFVAESELQLRQYINSLKQRASSIMLVAQSYDRKL